MANEFEAEMLLGIEKLKQFAFLQMFIISYISKACKGGYFGCQYFCD